MTDDMANLRALLERNVDSGLLRDMMGFPAGRMNLRLGPPSAPPMARPGATDSATRRHRRNVHPQAQE